MAMLGTTQDLADLEELWLFASDPGPFPGPPVEPPTWLEEWWPDPAAADPAATVPAATDPAEPVPAWAVPGVARPAPAVAPLLGHLREVLDAVEAAGPLSGSRADTALLLRLAERARALALREVAEMDAVGGHQVAGRTSTTASWLRDERMLSDASARATVRLAVQLRDELPGVGALLRSGATTVEHASAVVGGVHGLGRDTVRDSEQGLCALAQATDPADLRRRLRDKAYAVDDKLAAEAERRARERMGLRVSEVGSHTAVDGTLAGEDGSTVRQAMALAVEAARESGDTRGRAARQAGVLIEWARDYLHRQHGPGDSLADTAHTIRTHLLITCTPEQLAAEPLPEALRPSLAELLAADLADTTAAGADTAADPDAAGADTAAGPAAAAAGAARAAAGADTAAGLDDRVAGAGPADARADTAADPDAAVAGAGPADAGAAPAGPAGPVTPGIVGDGTPLSRGALRRLACDATLDLVVLRSATADATAGGLHSCPQSRDGTVCPHLRDPLYVGRSARTVSGLQFKALVARDRGCIVRGCPRPPAQCAAHHARHWADGGASDLDNLVLLCHQHHHDHHDRGLDLPHTDGIRWLTQTGWALAPP